MQNLPRLVFLLINPLIPLLLLMAITFIKNEYFGQAHFIIGAMAFAFFFPGRNYLNEPLQEMMNSIAVKWTGSALLILIIGNVSEIIDFIDKNTLLDWFISTPVMLIAVNGFARIFFRKLYSVDNNLKKAIIVGFSPLGLRLCDSFKNNKLLGVNFLGFFEDRNSDRIDINDENLLGKLSDVVQFCHDESVNTIYICIPISEEPRIVQLLECLKDTTASIYFAPDIFVTDLIQSKISHIESVPVVAICESPLTGVFDLEKRILDIILASLILLLTSPILIWVAYMVKKSSPGPIIFIQKRYGLDGKGIDVYKFRTMTVTENGDSSYLQVQKNDARVTKVGELLRKTSLDEFPQFVNVLQGRMSIVGPRPHVVAVNENYRKLIPGYMIRHKVRPGITGLAQVNGFRGGDDLEHMQGRIQYDLEYLKKWSISLDILIILKTAIMMVVGDKKAY